MSSVQNPGSARPSRVAGLILVAIALVALVLGVITLFSGGDDTPNAGPTGTRPPPSASQTSSQAPPAATTQPSATPTTAKPTAVTPSTPPPVNPRLVGVRVFNNGTVPKLAAQAAGEFRADGWNVVEVGNYAQGIIPTSTAYFRPGTEEEAAARAMAAKFNLKVEARFPGIAGASAGVIVMVTNDYGGK